MSEKDEIIELPEDIFRLLRDLIKDYCGIYFDDGSRYILERRLANRLRLQHMRDFREYYRYLMYDKRRDDELTAIIDILTVNETYFFREQNQLKAFIDEIIPEIYERNKEKKKIRIWSAGCSTGEEPYTIAMLVMEKGIPDNWDIDIVASDINQRVLQVARKGVYKKNSFRTTNNYFILKYFEEEQGGNFKISDAVKSLVNFSYLNILDPFKVKFVGQVDIIFCRNVFIYFDPAVRKRVVENFYDRLIEGGYLLLGHAESLMNISTAFTLKHLKNDMVYQKPLKARIMRDAG
ncbi:MAG: protein-glutamate O-methyltransferase CheR [Nitrospirae bacterium]|nr:protein-glutamate O-methyltransferase CheR [Nitrospirota bacterium]